jgi:EAL domain-containing protein (putative c-di-GMP-specific phosphodiesterase class I)
MTSMTDRLAQAISASALQVHYQPQVAIDSGAIVSMEALCRWTDDTLGTVAPDVFIPLAEASDLIVPLGRQVFRQVIKDLPALRAHWPRMRVAINFSVRELSEPDFPTWISETLADQAIDLGAHMEIEVTETIFQQDTQAVSERLQALRALGFSIAIDDFGTGQSSLSRLHTLPFDKIKLDRQFVVNLEKPMVVEIVRAVAGLTQRMGLGFVVEGVETEAQRVTLQSLGCPQFQGYLAYRPAPLEAWLASKPTP